MHEGMQHELAPHFSRNRLTQDLAHYLRFADDPADCSLDYRTAGASDVLSDVGRKNPRRKLSEAVIDAGYLWRPARRR